MLLAFPPVLPADQAASRPPQPFVLTAGQATELVELARTKGVFFMEGPSLPPFFTGRAQRASVRELTL